MPDRQVNSFDTIATNLKILCTTIDDLLDTSGRLTAALDHSYSHEDPFLIANDIRSLSLTLHRTASTLWPQAFKRHLPPTRLSQNDEEPT